MILVLVYQLLSVTIDSFFLSVSFSVSILNYNGDASRLVSISTYNLRNLGMFTWDAQDVTSDVWNYSSGKMRSP